MLSCYAVVIAENTVVSNLFSIHLVQCTQLLLCLAIAYNGNPIVAVSIECRI